METEITDNQLALRILEEEIAALEAHQAGGGNLDIDFENQNRHMSLTTYRPYFSIFFLAFCIIMFIASIGVNNWEIEDPAINPLFGPSVDTLLKLGAKDTQKLQDGELYRLLAPMVLHGGIIHLAANMLGLVMIGIPLEEEFGSVRIGVIIVSSGIVGILMSAAFAPGLVSVGASGGKQLVCFELTLV